MSQPRVGCRACQALLGVRRHSGRLHVAEGVHVVLDANGANGPILRLICRRGAVRELAI